MDKKAGRSNGISYPLRIQGCPVGGDNDTVIEGTGVRRGIEGHWWAGGAERCWEASKCSRKEGLGRRWRLDGLGWLDARRRPVALDVIDLGPNLKGIGVWIKTSRSMSVGADYGRLDKRRKNSSGLMRFLDWRGRWEEWVRGEAWRGKGSMQKGLCRC